MSYIPQTLLGIDSWAGNFNDLIGATPTAFGLTAPQAEAYDDAFQAFHTALNISNAPSTRTPAAVATTLAAKDALLSLTYSYAAIIQAYPPILPEQLTNLGLTVRKTTRTPVPAPTAIPVLAVQRLTPLETQLRIRTVGSDSNRFPPNVVGANIWCKIGDVAPISIADCTFVGRATTRFFTQLFDVADAGKNCFYLAQYVTKKDLVGPTSALLSTTVVG